MEVTGLLKVKGNVQQVSDKFKKRDVVLTVDHNTNYPQHVSFQLTNDKCDLIESHSVGEELTFTFNLRGREWTSPQGEVKYFNTLEVWKIGKAGKGESKSAPASSSKSNESNDSAKKTTPESSSSGIVTSQSFVGSEDDDLPF